LLLISCRDDAPQLGPLRRCSNHVQVCPLGKGRVGQQAPVGLRDRCVQERLPVGVPSPDGPVQGRVVEVLLTRAAG